jgi:hypothetical protein
MQQGALNTNRISIRGIGSRAQYGTQKIKAYYEGIPLTTAEPPLSKTLIWRLSVALKSSKDLILALVLV